MNSDSDSRLQNLENRQGHLNDEVARLRADMVALRREMDAEVAKTESPQGDPFNSDALKSTPPPLPRSQPKMDKQIVAKKAAPVEKPQPVVAKEPVEVVAARDVEMELGRVWLVRIGVGLLVTALVFFSTYAYQHYVLKLTAGGRLTVLMAAAFAVMGAGWWCEAKRKLVQFGQVLIGGGMAGVYYLTYAAHHVEKLQVLDSTTSAAVLMTLWMAVMLGYATWRKSQVAAVMSVLLASYAVVINPIGGLALFSALLLAIAAMVLMRQFGWRVLGAVSLGATYLGFAIWQMTNAAGQGSVELTALCGYWVVFTASLLLGRRATAESVEGSAPWLAGTRWQSFFATANNALFFGLLVADLRAMIGGNLNVIRDPFWVYSMGFGVVLLAVMAVTWLRLGWRAPLTQLYLAKGLALVTLGIMTKLTGYYRHLTLIVEACLMMAAVVFRGGGRVVRAAAWLVLILASFFALRSMNQESHLSALVFWGAACGFAVLAMLDARGRQPVETATGTMPSQSFAELPVISGIAVMIGGWALGLPDIWASVGVLSVVFVVIVPSTMLAVVALLELERHVVWLRALRILSTVLLLVICYAFFSLMELAGAGLLLGVVALGLLIVGRKIRGEEFLGVGLLGVGAALIVVALQSVDEGVPLWLAGGAVLLPVLSHLVWNLKSDEMLWPAVLLPSVVATPVAGVAVATAVVLFTTQVTQRFDGEGHAVIWAAIGIVAMILGFVLRERGYRLPALAVLGLALGHVLLVDVWQFDTLGRVLSFSVLGVAMILVGFFYNRFQEMLKKVAGE